MKKLEEIFDDKLLPVDEAKRQYYFIDAAKDIVAEKEAELGRKLTFCVNTFGCPIV